MSMGGKRGEKIKHNQLIGKTEANSKVRENTRTRQADPGARGQGREEEGKRKNL